VVICQVLRPNSTQVELKAVLNSLESFACQQKRLSGDGTGRPASFNNNTGNETSTPFDPAAVERRFGLSVGLRSGSNQPASLGGAAVAVTPPDLVLNQLIQFLMEIYQFACNLGSKSTTSQWFEQSVKFGTGCGATETAGSPETVNFVANSLPQNGETCGKWSWRQKSRAKRECNEILMENHIFLIYSSF